MSHVPFRGRIVFAVALCVAGIAPAAFSDGLRDPGAETVTLGSLLDEMVDREVLCRFPDPAYTCRQCSSFDRAAKDPGDFKTWYANFDRSHFPRVEEREGRREFVLMDESGPGAVVRFWITCYRGGRGTLRFYFDGEDRPSVEGPVTSLIGGTGLAEAPLSVHFPARIPKERYGHNLYLPIPYGVRCKITYESDDLTDAKGSREGEAFYYQVNYRTYVEGTKVETFSLEELSRCRSRVDEVQRILSRRDPGDMTSARIAASARAGALKNGEKAELAFHGPGAVRELSVKLRAGDLDQALRSTILEIAFDGQRTVWCPVGDFFGTGYLLRPHRTWYTDVGEDGTLTCRWVMPFEGECAIRLVNAGADPVEAVIFEARTREYDWDARSLHFHSTWRQYTRQPTWIGEGENWRQAGDMNFVTAKGKGIYVGDTLTLFNGDKLWWGEGDEKIYVDGETFPSHFGTGTEDYYCYAWGRPETFAGPFNAQPDGTGNNSPGFTVNTRFRSLDGIPFEESLRFDMELWSWSATVMNYAPATFWYARPGATSNVAPDPTSAALPVVRTLVDLFPPVPSRAGRIEGELFEVLDRTGGETEIQKGDHHWSGGAQLWWKDGKPGDRLTLRFETLKKGTFALKGVFTRAPDYGEVRFRLDGKLLDVTFDGYLGEVAPSDPIDLGVHELGPGNHRLVVELIGRNDQAEPRFMFGLDWLGLEKAP